jgi:hypothetical protein
MEASIRIYMDQTERRLPTTVGKPTRMNAAAFNEKRRISGDVEPVAHDFSAVNGVRVPPGAPLKYCKNSFDQQIYLLHQICAGL